MFCGPGCGAGPGEPNEELRSNVFQRLFYTWLTPILVLGNKQALVHEDLFDVRPAERANLAYQRFAAAMRVESDAAKAAKRTKGIVRRALTRVFARQMILAGLVKLCVTASQTVPLLLLRTFLQWIGNPEASYSEGFILVGAIFPCMLLKAVFENLYYHQVVMTGSQVRTMLSVATYEKSLRLSVQARQNFNTGEIVNLMQLHAARCDMFMMQFNHLWDGPLQLIIYLGLSVWLVGPATFFGLAVILVLVPVQGKIAKARAKQRASASYWTDNRVKLVTEIMQGIRAIKMYNWEEPWRAEVDNLRWEEMRYVRRMGALMGLARGFVVVSPQLILIAVFGAFALIFHQTMSADRVFAAMAVFMQMRMSLMFFPMALGSLTDTLQALQRFNSFLGAPEVEDYVHGDVKTGQIELAAGTFSYRNEGVKVSREGFDTLKGKGKGKGKGKDSHSKGNGKGKDASGNGKVSDKGNAGSEGLPGSGAAGKGANADGKPADAKAAEDRLVVIRGVSISVEPGQLVGVMGPVGCGKTTLVSALLGELCCLEGDLSINGRVAYAPQAPWIINASLRENILFGNPYDEKKYQEIVARCQLQRDIQQLPSGDETEIGEKGINLSGGQKQRVSLARACYEDPDIYFFDDPLSALDAEVGKAVYEQVILGYCGGKTRILVTHALFTKPACDKVYELAVDPKDGAGVLERVCTQVASLPAKTDQVTLENIHVEVSQPEDGPVPSPQKPTLMKAEGKAVGRVKLSVYMDYARSTGALWFGALAIATNVLSRACVDASTFWLASWTTGGDVFGLEFGAVEYFAVYVALGVALFVAGFLAAVMVVQFGIFASRGLHSQLFTRLARAPLMFFDTTPVGRIINCFSHDMEELDMKVPENMMSFMLCAFTVIGSFVSISIALPWFALTLPVFTGVYLWVLKFFNNSMREVKRLDSIALSPIYANFQQTLGGLSTIRAFGARERFGQQFAGAMDHYSRANYTLKSLNRWLGVRLETMGAFVMLFTGLIAVLLKGKISAGLAGVAVTYALQITSTLNFTVRMAAEAEALMNCAERVLRYAKNAPQERPYWSSEDASGALQAPPHAWPKRGDLELRDYVVRYRPETPIVLKGLSFAIEHGQKIGVVGRTGCGKSTLLISLLRLLEPEEGQLVVGGLDACTMGLAELRSAVAIVPQDPTLWSGSMRHNIDPFQRSTESEIWSVLEQVELKTAIEQRFPGQTLGDIMVVEGGQNFSFGQRQLFCLARAVLRGSRLVLMDEATSALDHETDALIQKTIRKVFVGQTLLVVAHRLRTVIDSDKILVLDGGEIAEFDHPATLLRNPAGHLSRLVDELGAEGETLRFMACPSSQRAKAPPRQAAKSTWCGSKSLQCLPFR